MHFRNARITWAGSCDIEPADRLGEVRRACSIRHEPGRAASARTADARAGTLLARCENVRTPALTGARQAPSLTARERDVAVLAAAGRSNREIAERLVVSVRTVESRLARVYRKLGAKDRNDLTRLLTPSGGHVAR